MADLGVMLLNCIFLEKGYMGGKIIPHAIDVKFCTDDNNIILQVFRNFQFSLNLLKKDLHTSIHMYVWHVFMYIQEIHVFSLELKDNL